MALDVDNNFDVRDCFGKIEAVARDNQNNIDRFFRVKAWRSTANGALTIKIDSGKPKKDAYRLANIALQGGGVLGLAHAGFVAGLEHVDVRFAGVAGASAGAIMAAGIAIVRGSNVLSPSSDELVKIVGSMPMGSFIDGPYGTRQLIKQFLLGKTPVGLTYWPAWRAVLRQILHKRGLNPGIVFEDWLRATFEKYGVRSVQQLNGMLDTIAKEIGQASTPAIDKADDLNDLREDLLQIMAASVPTGIKFCFPKDAEVLGFDTALASPARLVRASMSIPFFFEPVDYLVNRNAWPSFVHRKLSRFVDDKALKKLQELKQISFLDGGIFSNLPADAFGVSLSEWPSIAVPLMNSVPEKPFRRRAHIGQLANDIASVGFMVRNQRDRDAIEQLESRRERFAKRPGVDRLAFPFQLAEIDVGDANWLNFVMDGADMTKLFLLGLKRAERFLRELGKDQPAMGDRHAEIV